MKLNVVMVEKHAHEMKCGFLLPYFVNYIFFAAVTCTIILFVQENQSKKWSFHPSDPLLYKSNKKNTKNETNLLERKKQLFDI